MGKMMIILSVFSVDEQSENMIFRLVKDMSEHEGVADKLKAENAVLEVGKKNEIQVKARKT